MSGRIEYDLTTSVKEEYTFNDQCGVILTDTVYHRVTARDRNGNKTVVQERLTRLPFRDEFWLPLPLSFADLEESLSEFVAAMPECPDHHRRDIVDTVLSHVRCDAEARGDSIVGAFRASVDVDLYTQEEAEPGSFPGYIKDAETCSICEEVLWGNGELITTGCDHVFHSSCVTPWLEKSPTCPFCGKSLES